MAVVLKGLLGGDLVLDRGVLAGQVADRPGWVAKPGWIDSHCHILPTGLDLKRVNLSSAGTKAEVLDLLRDALRERPAGWL
ncbi:MAG: hypothetical protein MH204_11810, partial [Fimbriimonadaceae bacterium]|nr:hypothetical protein [Fimbriimonadaceae bacterium]